MTIGKREIHFSVMILLIFIPSLGEAYIGPGAGLTAIGTFVALVGAILLLIIGFIWYPIKRMLRKTEKPDQCIEGNEPNEPS